MKILICRIWIAFALSLAIGDAAFAQGQTINQLGNGAPLVGTEKIPMYQSANPAVTTTPNAIKTFILSTPIPLASGGLGGSQADAKKAEEKPKDKK